MSDFVCTVMLPAEEGGGDAFGMLIITVVGALIVVAWTMARDALWNRHGIDLDGWHAKLGPPIGWMTLGWLIGPSKPIPGWAFTFVVIAAIFAFTSLEKSAGSLGPRHLSEEATSKPEIPNRRPRGPSLLPRMIMTTRAAWRAFAGWIMLAVLLTLAVLLIVEVTQGVKRGKQKVSIPEVDVIRPFEVNIHSDILMRSYRDAELAHGLQALEAVCSDLEKNGVKITGSRLSNLVDEAAIRKMPEMVNELKATLRYELFIKEAAMRVKKAYSDL